MCSECPVYRDNALVPILQHHLHLKGGLNPYYKWHVMRIEDPIYLSPRILVVEYHLSIISHPHSNTLGVIRVFLVELLRTDATNVPDIVHAQETIPRRCECALIVSFQYQPLMLQFYRFCCSSVVRNSQS